MEEINNIIDKLNEKREKADEELSKALRQPDNRTEKELTKLDEEFERREKELAKLQKNYNKIHNFLLDELDSPNEHEELYDKLNDLQEEIDKLDEELEELEFTDKQKEAFNNLNKVDEEYDDLIGGELAKIEEELEQTDDDEKIDTLLSRLQYLDPYDERFHLACPNWPNCESEGCGEW